MVNGILAHRRSANPSPNSNGKPAFSSHLSMKLIIIDYREQKKRKKNRARFYRYFNRFYRLFLTRICYQK